MGEQRDFNYHETRAFDIDENLVALTPSESDLDYDAEFYDQDSNRPPDYEINDVPITEIKYRVGRYGDRPGIARRGRKVMARYESATIYEKTVWERGRWLPVRPFYERRLEKAKDNAGKILKSVVFSQKNYLD